MLGAVSLTQNRWTCRCFRALPFAQMKLVLIRVFCCRLIQKFLRALRTLHVVTEFDNFVGHVVLRYGEYNGVGIYLIDAPHLIGEKGILIMIPITMIMPITISAFALIRLGGAELTTGFRHSWYEQK